MRSCSYRYFEASACRPTVALRNNSDLSEVRQASWASMDIRPQCPVRRLRLPPSRRTLSRVQRGETIFTRTSVLGRLVAFAIAGGVLAAAMVIPVVAATGVLVRNQADKFTNLSLNSAGLPQRSQILDRYGHLLAYVYGVDAPYDNHNLHYFGWNREPVG